MSTRQVNGLEVSSQDPSQLFDILSKLGEGSYGIVYRGLDKRDGKVVAIKVLEVDGDDASELQREIHILKECDSDFIVRYRGSFFKDNRLWIVMEYCGAGSLCDLMAICERTLSEEQIAAVMKQALLALQYLHSQKKLHRDIKSGKFVFISFWAVPIVLLIVSCVVLSTACCSPLMAMSSSPISVCPPS